MKTLVMVLGPPAVGKMTVGAAICARTGFKLFHNHVAIDVVLPYFDFGTPPFQRLVGGFRRRMFEEVAASELPGLVFTYAWAFDVPSDKVFVDGLCAIFRDVGARVVFVELQAPQAVRLARNETAFRLEKKAPKRDLARSRGLLLDHDAQYRFHSEGELSGPDYLRIDNTDLSPDDAADLVVRTFGLQGPAPTPG